MEKINFTGTTGAQAFRAIDSSDGVNDDEISANMEAWARVFMQRAFGTAFVNAEYVAPIATIDDLKLIAAITKFGNVSASYASTLAGHLQNCTEFDSELINEAAEELMLQDREVKCMEEKIKTLEAELEAVGAGGVQPLRNPNSNASVNQKMLEALRATVAEDEDTIDACKIMGYAIPGDMMENYKRCKDAIAQAEAQQAARHD